MECLNFFGQGKSTKCGILIQDQVVSQDEKKGERLLLSPALFFND